MLLGDDLCFVGTRSSPPIRSRTLALVAPAQIWREVRQSILSRCARSLIETSASKDFLVLKYALEGYYDVDDLSTINKQVSVAEKDEIMIETLAETIRGCHTVLQSSSLPQ